MSQPAFTLDLFCFIWRLWLWLSRTQRKTFHQPRLRLESYGELIQIDGSDHRWFEQRGEPCTLLVFIGLEGIFYKRRPSIFRRLRRPYLTTCAVRQLRK